MIDWSKIVSSAPEIVIAVLFAWFALTITQRQQEFLKFRDEQNSKTQTERDKSWQDFMNLSRQSQNEGVSRLAEEIKRMMEQMTAQNALLISHDDRSREILESLRRMEKK